MDEDKFECIICSQILRDPVLTRCGHRFCNECLSRWLRENKNHCPMDSQLLDRCKDVFPDNYTKRQISELQVVCPFECCNQEISMAKYEHHIAHCPHKDPINNGDDSEKGCPYEKVGCLTRGTAANISTHLKSDLCEHMQLVLRQFEQFTTKKETCQNCCKHTDGCTLNEKDTNGFNDQLLLYFRDIYEKLTKLDQCSREYAIKIEQCTNELNIARNALSKSNGLLLWEIDKFDEFLMISSNNPMPCYSPPFSTSAYGYRFCIRLTLSKTKLSLAIILHMLKGNYDHVLTWPFVGEIMISVIHPIDSNIRLTSVIKANQNSEAFSRPTQKMNPCGFGFPETTAIPDLVQQGFLQNDKLVMLVSARSNVAH